MTESGINKHAVINMSYDVPQLMYLKNRLIIRLNISFLDLKIIMTEAKLNLNKIIDMVKSHK